MHDPVILLAVLVATLHEATPLLLAGLGELVTERSGVLNLGVEGMMAVGAATGFIGAAASHSLIIGLICAVLGGVAMAAGFAVLTLGLLANQVASGLALTIFGLGLSALLGAGWQGTHIDSLATAMWPDRAHAGPALQQILSIDPLMVLAFAVPVLVSLFLRRSRAGLVLRAVGESHDVAHALGYRVIRVRALAVLFGGAMSGLAGASLSLAYTPMWTEGLVAGRGWIALALVVFSTWKPLYLVGGALLFGFVTIAQYQAEGFGLDVSPHLLAMLPYLVTVLVLVLISRDRVRLRLAAPAALGRAFHATA